MMFIGMEVGCYTIIQKALIEAGMKEQLIGCPIPEGAGQASL
jgi:hypothetical protein